jgi:UDP-2-acetamido-3-amino-2,3-dideoxy-glucuronate N-acetyltransferase
MEGKMPCVAGDQRYLSNMFDRPVNFIDPSAEVDASAKIWHFAVVLAEAWIKEGVVIGSRTEIGARSIIGKNSRIGSGTFLPPGSVIGEGVFIGPNVTFTDDKYPVAGNANYTAQPPIVGSGASIGAGAVILPGVVIMHNARIGAGAIVTHSVAAGALVRSEPARERGDGCPPELIEAMEKIGLIGNRDSR